MAAGYRTPGHPAHGQTPTPPGDSTDRRQSWLLTRRGAPVARPVPYRDTVAGFRPARRPPVFSVNELVHSSVSSDEILADLREER